MAWGLDVVFLDASLTVIAIWSHPGSMTKSTTLCSLSFWSHLHLHLLPLAVMKPSVTWRLMPFAKYSGFNAQDMGSWGLDFGFSDCMMDWTARGSDIPQLRLLCIAWLANLGAQSAPVCSR